MKFNSQPHGKKPKNHPQTFELRKARAEWQKHLWSGGQDLSPSLPSWLAVSTLPHGLLSSSLTDGGVDSQAQSQNARGDRCDFWLRLLRICGNKKRSEGEGERDPQLERSPCPTERRTWRRTKQLTVSSSTKGPGRLEHRGAAVTHSAQAVLALRISASLMGKHLGYLMSAALFLEIYAVYPAWQLANL